MTLLALLVCACSARNSAQEESNPTSLTEVWRYAGDNTTYFNPRVYDLDGDGVLDVVVGHGTIDGPGAMLALDGETGVPLWQAALRRQIYASAVFLDVTKDGIPEVFAGGRGAEFAGVDGSNGRILWQFMPQGEPRQQGWFNFYTASRVPDQDSDGFDDLLIANGGDDEAEGSEPRATGHLIVLSSATGAMLSTAPVPDREETYMSTQVLSLSAGEEPSVLFGTGGETRLGSLWRAPLRTVISGTLDGSTRLLSGNSKGAIAPPAFADMNGDGVIDILGVTFDARVAAIDGATNQVLWEHRFEGAESYSTPTLGFFDADSVPDAFISVLFGTYPTYAAATHLLMSGADGRILWQQTAGNLSLAGGVAVDLNGDGIDEVIFTSVDLATDLSHAYSLYLLDTKARTLRPWGEPSARDLPSSPWIGDLDADGWLDLIVPRLIKFDDRLESHVTRYRLNAGVPEVVHWGGYLGTDLDGQMAR